MSMTRPPYASEFRERLVELVRSRRGLSTCGHGQAEQPPADRAEKTLTAVAHRRRSQSGDLELPPDLDMHPAHSRPGTSIPWDRGETTTLRPKTRGESRRRVSRTKPAAICATS